MVYPRSGDEAVDVEVVGCEEWGVAELVSGHVGEVVVGGGVLTTAAYRWGVLAGSKAVCSCHRVGEERCHGQVEMPAIPPPMRRGDRRVC